MGKIVGRMSSRLFNMLSIVANIVFMFSIAGIIFYTTFVTETMTWKIAIALGFLIVSYSLAFFKKPDFKIK